jgi:hypothetical protein
MPLERIALIGCGKVQVENKRRKKIKTEKKDFYGERNPEFVIW